MKISGKNLQYLKRVLMLVFFAAVAWLLVSRGRQTDWDQVWTSVQAYDAGTIATGLAFTLSAYLAFGCYDLLAKRALGHKVPAPRVLGIGMVAYALNLNLGALVGGWASRFHLYSRAGVKAAMTTRIIGLGLLSNWTGYLLIAGLVFSFAPPPLPPNWVFAPRLLPVIGAGLLLVVGAYLLFCAVKPGQRLHIGRLELHAPTLGFAGLQLLASAVHWGSTCLVISCYLPDDLSFTTIMGVLLMSSIAGAAVHIPGGLGVIEAVFLSVLDDRYPAAQLLGALLAYRASFYLVPLLFALIAFAILELRSRKQGDRSISSAEARSA